MTTGAEAETSTGDTGPRSAGWSSTTHDQHGAAPACACHADRCSTPLHSAALRRLVGRLSRHSDDAALADFAAALARANRVNDVHAAITDAVRAMAPGATARIAETASRSRARGGIEIPLRFLGQIHGVLRVQPASRQGTLDARLVRRLERLAPLAASALQACAARPTSTAADLDRRRRRVILDLPRANAKDPATGLPDAEFLDAALARALASAPATPLAVLIIEPDALEHVRTAQGEVYADLALGVVARAVLGTLRSSDPVVRFDHDRLAALLPGASTCDAWHVARALTQAIEQAGLTASTPRPLTATVRVVTAPEHGSSVAAIRAALARHDAELNPMPRDTDPRRPPSP